MATVDEEAEVEATGEKVEERALTLWVLQN